MCRRMVFDGIVSKILWHPTPPPPPKQLLPQREPAFYSYVLHFLTFNCLCNHCHLWSLYPTWYSLFFLISLLSSFVVHFSFYSIFSLCYFFLICLCLFVCFAGIGSGSSPTSSQNEALPPSTDWPVSAYTSSFSLSSPEADDAGT